jgi:aspartate aminotransferase-like enzyme
MPGGAGLRFDFLETGWGQPFDRKDIERALDRGAAWLWAVHCETSTGVLNDLVMLKDVCAERGVRLAMDCVSSVGTVPVDLSGVALASCASGKGLGAYPGLSMVFYGDGGISAPGRLPRYLDLGQYAAKDGVPFTLSTNLLYALDAAIRDLNPSAVFDCISEAAGHLRAELREMGFRIVADDACATPAVTTLALPASDSSVDVGQRLEKQGFLLSYNSEYLVSRNWIQVCLMVPLAAQGVMPLLAALRGVLSLPQRRSVAEKVASR